MAVTERQSIVIVGAGQTGTRAALSLRDLGWHGNIVLIGGEAHMPYERPPLSKDSLMSDNAVEGKLIATAATFAAHQIEYLKGIPAVSIDRAGHTVILADGSRYQYDKLLLATGRSPRTLPEDVSRVDQHVLRTIGDSERLKNSISAGKHLLVIGGGLIGLEVASAAVSRGAAVTVVETQDRLMQRAVPAAIAAAAMSVHSNKGVRFHLQTSVHSIQKHGGKLVSKLSDGTTVLHDTVLSAIGATPNIKLAKNAGLATNIGIMVDDKLQTSDSSIFAAGDVAEICLPDAQTAMLIETWRNADDQGAFVAANLLGESQSWQSVPWFWSDQYDLSIQGAGLSKGYAAVERRYPNGDLIVFTLSDREELVGVHAIGTPRAGRDVRIGQMHIARGSIFAAERLADPNNALNRA